MLRDCLRGALGVIAMVCLAAATASASTQKIGDGLYAYISSNDSSSNSVFLVGESGILVVDTGVNSEEGGKLLAEIRKVSQQPIRWIVNTHYHPDHRAGNDAVGPDAVIISSSFTRDKVLAGARKSNRDYSLNEVVDKNGITLYLNGH